MNGRLREIAAVAQRLDSRRGEPLSSRPGRNQPLVLCGVGALGQMTLAHLQQLGIRPQALTDNNPLRWGTSQNGIPILSPVDAVLRHGPAARFVVTVYNGSAVRRQLRDLGCVHVSHFADLFFDHADEFLPFCGLATRSVILDAWAEVESAAMVWSDSRSRSEYVAQLAWRLRLPECPMPQHDSPEQCYFPDDLFEFLPDEVLFDCGAFDGDSVRQYLARRPVDSRPTILAFEPDAASCARLTDFVRQLPPWIGANVRIEPRAVGERTGPVKFAALGSVRSGVQESGAADVEAVALDDLGIHPSLIKMDVEGFELPALRGAAAILRNQQPVLAISLYHHASDLWTIPNYLQALVPDYSFFLRRYAEDCWELVLYAVPSSRLVGSSTPAPDEAVTS